MLPDGLDSALVSVDALAHDVNNLLATIDINLNIMGTLLQQARPDALGVYVSAAADATQQAGALMRRFASAAAAAAARDAAKALAASCEQARAPLALPPQAAQSGAAAQPPLRDSAEWYRAMFESIDEGFCIIEKMGGDVGGAPLDFRYIEANPAFVVHSGLSGVVGKTLRQVIPDECADWLLTYDAVCTSGVAVRFERGLVTQGRVLELYAFALNDATRRCVGVSFKDITERKRTEDLLRKNHATFSSLIQSAPFGLYVVDAQFRLWEVSAASRKVFSQITPLIGRDFEDILRIVWTEPFVSEALARFRHTLHTGAPYAASNTIEQRANVADIESYDWKIERITLPDGTFGVACYFYDVTERQLAAEALRESEERYRNLFDSIDEGFCVIEMLFDEAGKPVDYLFLETNPNFEKQIRLPGAAGKRASELLPGLEAHWFDTYGKVALTGESIRFTKELGAMDVLLDVYACRVGGAQSRKVAIVFNNITERSRLEQQARLQAASLLELDRRKDEFLAMLSHELRNPLAPLSNAVQLLRLQIQDDPLQQQACNIIAHQVGQLTHLVDDLLDVSRITTGRIQLRCAAVAARSVVERAVETAHPLITQRRHGLTVSLPAQPIWLHADVARLEQVAVNLLTNAAKYTDEGGHIWLSVEQDGDAALLRVRDNGIGIAAEILPRIFDLFTQAERSLDRSQGGLGIGLCLVRRLVELHGGSVEAHSIVGQGSEFIVRLPAMPVAGSPPPMAADVVRLAEKFCRILIVDDNVDLARSQATLLEVVGHAVRIAYDGPSALEIAIDDRPDVVLLDIGLPGMSGFDVARRIRQHPAIKEMVLIAMTGYGQDADRQRSREAGFDHHLVKPVDFGKLQILLARIADRASPLAE
ncbi:MAG: response regulator [Massilia sp.]|nr:response regulator [Massilia sp.]